MLGAGAGRSRPGGVACVVVDDLDRATEYYRLALGFDVDTADGRPAGAAVVRRGDAALLLQEATVPQPSYSRDRDAEGAWDGLFLIDDLEGLARDVDARGAHVVFHETEHPSLGSILGVRDYCGNVLCFGTAPSTLAGRARRLARQAVPLPVRAEWRQRRSAREERPHLERFREFYAGLDRKDDVFYMTFRAGLLHWVATAARFAPPEVNLVLIGSDLPQSERTWLREHLDRPFHHIDLTVDDKTVWEFLFAVNERHFGAIDTDCFVLDPRLFETMARIEDDVAVNAVWSYDSGSGFRIANTHLVFVNADVIRALRRARLRPSPCTYDWSGEDRRVPGRSCVSRIPTRRQRRELLRILPADARGRPRIPGDASFFDTLVVHQLLARARGYRTHLVRPFERPAVQATPALQLSSDGEVAPAMSDEVVHIGGASFYDRYFHAPDSRALYLAAEHVLLEPLVGVLPGEYGERLGAVRADLERFGVDPDSVAGRMRAYLHEVGGLSPSAVDRLVA